eukprot:gene19201-22621_t
MASQVEYAVPLDDIIGDTSHIPFTKHEVQVRGLSIATFLYTSSTYKGIKKPPVVALHGGPAFTHNYIVPLKLLADHGHDVIFYDQGGCGESTHVDNVHEKAPWLLTMEYYLEELQAVISHHQLTEYYLYGSSWGTMVAQEWAVTRPRGLYGLLLDGALCDPHLYIQTQWRDRLGTLPEFSQRMLKDIIARKDFSHPALPLLDDALGKMFSLRTVPRPDVWQKCFDQMDKTIYVEMQGVCEFTIGGLLETWSVIERLHLVQVPTIVLAGEFDTMTVECSKAVVDNIPTAWPLVIIPRASHCKLLEEPAACIREMSKFLNTVEA